MDIEQKTHTGLGSLKSLKQILSSYDVSRIMIVTGKKSFKDSGAKALISRALDCFKVTYFSDFAVNPKLSDAKKGVKLLKNNDIELIISIGGGSVIDMAKLIKAFYSNPGKADSIAKGLTEIIDPKIPLIAIPTTAGSGSESTHFAVVYIGKEKFSVAHKCLLPYEIILDGSLTISATKYQKACNVLDAISQSIESAWAVAATSQSQKISFLALKKCMNSFYEYVNSEDSLEASQSMIEASNLAGQAINISKTTAAHAWSYAISMRYNIPHGHAVWATLPRIFEIHSLNSDLIINGPYGKSYLNKIIRNIREIMNMPDGESAIDYFNNFLASIGIPANLVQDLKILKSERKELSNAVNEERMANNPVKFSDKQISFIFEI